MADNVATRSIRAKIDQGTDIIDQELFKSKLEELKSDESLPDTDKQVLDELLGAWNNQINGRDE